MMLHRHFADSERKDNITTVDDLKPKAGETPEEMPPDEVTVEAPKKRGRKKKTEE